MPPITEQLENFAKTRGAQELVAVRVPRLVALSKLEVGYGVPGIGTQKAI